MKRQFIGWCMLLCTCLTYAQPTPSQVEVPGSKGLLPKTADIAPAREGEIPILTLSHVGYAPIIINGYVDIEANLSFPMVEEVGCEYYTAQYRAHGTTAWETMKSGGTTWQISDRSVGISPDIYSVTDYRLVLHGGEKDGLVSNTVTARPLSMASRYTGWSESPSVEHCMVGVPIGESFTFSAETYESGNITKYNFEENPEYFRYQWYRSNPNNGDREQIQGATDRIYTPLPEDIGYQLVLEVSGDKEHCDFYLYHPFSGVVCVPVQASVAYIGSDGFILNTDYVIPEPQNMFVLGEMWMEDAPVLNPDCISEIKPGQYTFRLPEEEYNYCIYEMADPAYFLTFIYKDIWGDGEDWYREVQLMTDRYKGCLTVKAALDGNAVSNTIDVVGKNIDGQYSVIASMEMNTDGEAVFEQDWNTGTDNRVFLGDHYVKARATESTMETYYPATSLWISASPVSIESENSWNPKQVEISLQPLPAPLTGIGIIEGIVNSPTINHARARAAALQTSIMVYLLDAQSGDIVAQATTDDAGRFRFENVPFGSYKVLPNIDGCTVSTPAEVEVTAENPVISEVDYTITEGEVIPDGIRSTTASKSSAVQGVWSLSGCQKATRGLNIMRMSDGTIKKVILK